MDNIADVINLSSKYNVLDGIELCVKFLVRNLNAENVCQIYGLAIIYNQQGLKQMCEQEITFNASKVFKSSDFLKCNQIILEYILNLDEFSCREVDVYEACMSWVKNVSACDELTRELIDENLGDLLFMIRFKSMTNDEFANILSKYEAIFSLYEQLEISQMICSEEYEPILFNGNERICITWNERSAFKCDRYMGHLTKCYFIGNVDITTFTSNKTLLLGRVRLNNIFRSINGGEFEEDVTAKMTITAIMGPKILYIYNIEIKKGILKIMIELPEQILIRSGVKYEIRLDLERSVYVQRGLKSEVQIGSDINIQFNRDQGLIDELYFNRV